jgi:hypothetical protein
MRIDKMFVGIFLVNLSNNSISFLIILTQLSETSKTETVFMLLKTITNQLYPFETPHFDGVTMSKAYKWRVSPPPKKSYAVTQNETA